MEPVIVVGAGPVGLALALSLARAEVPVTVLDAGDGRVVERAARTCLLRPETAALLPAVPGSRWRGWHTRRRRQLLDHIDLKHETAPLHVTQHVLEKSLRGALAAQDGVRLVTGTRLDGLDQDEEGVTAHTGAGRFRGSHLVGCDGARSTVRKLVGVRFLGRTAVERHAVATVRVSLPQPGEALLHRDPDGVPGEVTARPLPDNKWRLDWLLPPRGELVTPEQLLGRVHDTLCTWRGDGQEAPPYELLDTGVHTCHQRLARRWRVGRVFLAGDAAHLLGALGTQAVEEGLRDALNLAWKLALARRGGPGAPGTEVLLDSYEAERRTAVARRLRAVDHALPLVRRGGTGVRALLPGSGARAGTAMLADGQLGRGPLGAAPGYDRSPLTPPDLTGAVAVGTPPGGQVEDVPVLSPDHGRGRLRDWLGGAGGDLLAVLVAPGAGVWDSRHWRSAGLMPSLATAVEQLPLHARLLVAEDYPGAPPHTLLVVRPDGHLVAAVPGTRTDQLLACAEALAGTAAADREQDGFRA
ncbi:MAG TPA: FAD-dependent monooxygenase [Streptomyces sp.]|nr:FAD-dependent monooxygenase [Streptomyces sp.]